MAFLRVGWRSRIDRLWQARAEKQRRLGLGLGEAPTPPRLTANDSISVTASEAGFMASNEFDFEIAAEDPRDTQDCGDGADRVGTLLVRMGQLDGVGGTRILSLAPKAVATLMLEESSATVEEMDLETNVTEVCVPCDCLLWVHVCHNPRVHRVLSMACCPTCTRRCCVG